MKEPRNRLTAAQLLQQVFVELPSAMEDTTALAGSLMGVPMLPSAQPAAQPVMQVMMPRPAPAAATMSHEQQQEMKQLQHRVTELQSQVKDHSDKQLKAIRSLEGKVATDEPSSSFASKTCSIS